MKKRSFQIENLCGLAIPFFGQYLQPIAFQWCYDLDLSDFAHELIREWSWVSCPNIGSSFRITHRLRSVQHYFVPIDDNT